MPYKFNWQMPKLDKEWPRLKLAFESWLDSSNFDQKGEQIQSLAAFQ